MSGRISIDLGSVRIKVAIWRQEEQSSELIRFPPDQLPYFPSVYYLDEKGHKVFGGDAIQALAHNPAGGLRNAIKKELCSKRVVAGNGETARPVDVVHGVLEIIIEVVRSMQILAGDIPEAITFCVPREYSVDDKEVLRSAATKAGVLADKVSFIDDPVAAVQAWYWATEMDDDQVVILDCGGGSARWSCVRRVAVGRYEIIPEYSGDERADLGLIAVSEGILGRLFGETTHCALGVREQFAKTLDEYFRSNKPESIIWEISGRIFPLETIVNLLDERYVAPLSQYLGAFLNKIAAATNNTSTTVLVVGGGAICPELLATLESVCGANVVWIEDVSEYAAVLGAHVPGESRIPMEVKKAIDTWSRSIDSAIVFAMERVQQ